MLPVVLPTVAVADLHGHPDHLARLVDHLDGALGEYRLVTLGDYCDNGPDVPGLLDRLIVLHAERPGRVVSILGNHDLACLRTLGWPGETPDPVWYRAWMAHYWDAGLGTPAAYGAVSAEALAQAMPSRHQRFLAALPWVHDDGRHLFVHAGMQPGPLGPQVAELVARRLPPVHLHQPPPIRDKALSRQADPTWDRLVVSAHNKHLGLPFFEGPKRLCLSGEIDRSGRLFAAVLPGDCGPQGDDGRLVGQVLAVERSGRISTIGNTRSQP